MDTLVVAKRYLRLNAISITTPHHPFQGYSNHTITTSVTIRVTPIQDHFVPWGILWAGFVVASAIAAWQAVREHQILALRRAAVDNGGPTGASVVGDGESVSSADITRCMVRFAY